MLRVAVLCMLVVVVFGSSSKPGQCKTNKDCSNGYRCIAVENSVPGLSQVSQCTPTTACAGIESGYCPTFSSWPKAYRVISPVCAFVKPTNCKAPGFPDPSNTTVDCFNITDTKLNQTFTGIFKCVDSKTYKADSTIPYVNDHLNDCKSKNGQGVCNGAGTCAPADNLVLNKYTCKCNEGFKGSNNCEEITSNKCNNLGQCGAQGTCNTSSKECECKKGVTGNQCSKCDKANTNACSNKGTCGTDGSCKCNDGSTGQFCESESSSGSILSVGLFNLLAVSVFTLRL